MTIEQRGREKLRREGYEQGYRDAIEAAAQHVLQTRDRLKGLDFARANLCEALAVGLRSLAPPERGDAAAATCATEMQCDACDGRGFYGDSRAYKCPTCDGSGSVPWPCKTCGGTKRVPMPLRDGHPSRVWVGTGLAPTMTCPDCAPASVANGRPPADAKAATCASPFGHDFATNGECIHCDARRPR